jgi:hypothetical protein
VAPAESRFERSRSPGVDSWYDRALLARVWQERVFDNFDPFHYVRSEPVVMRGTGLLVGAYDGVFVVSDGERLASLTPRNTHRYRPAMR